MERRDDFEQRLAECLEARLEGDAERLEAILAAHPEHAARLTERLEQLERLGLMDERESKLGHYRLRGRIGEGGMGVVYDAVHDDGREVALKVLPPATDERATERFRREARAIAALKHEGIVEVVEFGEADGRTFLALERMHGVTLAEAVGALREQAVEGRSGEDLGAVVPSEAPLYGRTYVEAACRIVLAIARALEHAHSQGVIHRDVKPSNIWLGTDGGVRLFDFGLAHLVDADSLTRTGDFAGTPSYTSPEQLAGERDLDGRTDVFSLGATLYELLTGRKPFEGDSTAAVFRAIQSRDPIPLRRHNPAVPTELETLCLTALAKEKSGRYDGAKELAEDLERFLAFRPVHARPLGPVRRLVRWSKRHPGAASAIGLVAAGMIAAPLVLLRVNQVIRDERDRAEESARLSADVVEYLVGLFRGVPGEERSARQLLDEGVERLPVAFEGDATSRAALLEASGRAYALMGLHAEAIPLFDRAFALRSWDVGAPEAEEGDSLLLLAQAYVATGDGPAAAALCRRSLEVLQRDDDVDAERIAMLRHTLARALVVSGEVSEARQHFDLALKGATGESLADVLCDYARLYLGEGDREEAARLAEEAWDLRKQVWSPKRDRLQAHMRLLADVHTGDESEQTWRERADRLEASSTPVTDPPFSYLPDWRGDYEERFQDGIGALQGNRWADAAMHFEGCLELAGEEPVCAYNIACAFAHQGELDRAFEWLEKASAWGFGRVPARLEVARQDPELNNLRRDSRWSPWLAEMDAGMARVAEYTSEPGWIPAPPDAPLLVVWHADGSTKDEVLAGPWGDLARERGLALLAPSGVYSGANEPEDGLQWTHNTMGFVRDPKRYTASARQAMDWLEREHGERTGPLVFAGKGRGAALAFDLALRAPVRVSGVVLEGAAPHPRSLGERARLAEAMGLEVGIVLDDEDAALEEWVRHNWRGPLTVSVAGRGEIERAVDRALARQ